MISIYSNVTTSSNTYSNSHRSIDDIDICRNLDSNNMNINFEIHPSESIEESLEFFLLNKSLLLNGSEES